MTDSRGWQQETRKVSAVVADARRNVGGTSEDQAKWLLKFANTDPRQVKKARHYELMHEVAAVVRSRTLGFYSNPPDVVPWAEVVRSWKWLRQGLIDLRRPESGWMEKASYTHHFAFRNGRLLSWNIPGFGNLPWFQLAVREILKEAQKRLRLCGNPKCGRLLVAHRRQIYCRRACSQATRTRKYRDLHAMPMRKKRRLKYVAKMQAVHGPRVSVRQRSRAGD